MFKKWFVLFIIMIFLMLPLLALAQDSVPTVEGPVVVDVTTPTAEPVIVEPPPPDPVVEEPGDPPATTPENLLGQIFQLLKDGTYIVWAAAGVLVIVGVIKLAFSLFGIVIEGNWAILITLVVQVLIWLTYSIANYFGQGAAYQEWYNRVIDVLRALLPLAGAIFAANWGYAKARTYNTPVIGFKAKPKALSVNVR